MTVNAFESVPFEKVRRVGAETGVAVMVQIVTPPPLTPVEEVVEGATRALAPDGAIKFKSDATVAAVAPAAIEIEPFHVATRCPEPALVEI